MREIARKLFVSLNRDSVHSNHYYVLNDGRYLDDFWADNDHEAIGIFRDKEWA